jgi:GNAT superfamily N-acetyltransferase
MKIRPASLETDLQSLAGVCSACEHYESGTIEEEVRTWLEYMATGRISRCLVAVDENDSVTGYSAITHEGWESTGVFHVFVGVAPACRGRKIGPALWETSLDFLQAQGATRLKSEVRDDEPVGLAFAEQRGFRIDRHTFGSGLDLAAFNETPYLPGFAALEAQGIRFCTLADFPDTPGMRQKLFDLNNTCTLDIPGSDGDVWSFPEFEKFVLGAPSFAREGQFLAVDGNIWAGLAGVSLHPETHSAYNERTGVLSAYRGRKIAQALKVLAARYARRQGASRLDTHNDSLNAPMLAINRKLGYRPQPGKYKLVRTMDAPEK